MKFYLWLANCYGAATWNGDITGHRDAQIAGVAAPFTDMDPTASGIELKGVEDGIDAVIGAWVAVCALEGRATPFGDEVSAIWVPHPIK